MKRTTLVGFGILTLVGALLATVGVVPSAGAVIARDTTVLAIGALLTVFGFALLGGVVAAGRTAEADGSSSKIDHRGDEPVVFPPAATRESDLEPEQISQDVETALSRSRLGEPLQERRNRSVAQDTVRRAVTDAVVTSLTADSDLGDEAARDQIHRGRWTDDPRAAAFLSTRISVPLAIRIEDWATGQGEQRQLEAALEALTALRSDDPPASSQQLQSDRAYTEGDG